MKRADMEKDKYRENQGYREQGEKSKYKERIQRDKERNPESNPAIFAHEFLCFSLYLYCKSACLLLVPICFSKSNGTSFRSEHASKLI